MSDTDFGALWTREFVDGLCAKRAEIAKRFTALKNVDTSYYRGYVTILRLYDAAIAAVSAPPVPDNSTTKTSEKGTRPDTIQAHVETLPPSEG